MQESAIGRSPDALRQEDELSLFDIILTLWRHRVLLVIWTGAFAVLVGLALLLILAFSPPQERMSLQFRLTFSGAEEGQYPNGQTFSPEDIAASEVLDRAYEKSGIATFMDRRQFGDSITVMKSDEGLKFLEEMYEPLLSERSRYTAQERETFRRQYQEARDQLFRRAPHALYFSDVHVKNIPNSVRANALYAVLSAWAEFSERHRGIYVRPIAMISEDYFDEIDKPEPEPMIQVDKMRLLVNRLQDIASDIAKLPGVLVTQTSDGQHIETLQLRLEHLERYQVAPLLGIIRKGRIYNDLLAARTYVNQRLYSLNLDADRYEGALKLVQDVMGGYLRRDMDPAQQASAARQPVANFGDRFLDRLVALTNQAMETQYRQGMSEQMLQEGDSLLATQSNISFYRDMAPEESHDASRLPVAPAERLRLKELFETRYVEAVATAREINGALLELESIVRRRNLEANQQMYSIITPPLRSDFGASGLSMKRVVVFALAPVFAFFAFLCIIFLMMDRFQNVNSGAPVSMNFVSDSSKA